MCLVVTIIMLVLSIQNLMMHQWLLGIFQLVIALGFLFLLMRNIQKVRCDRNAACTNGCAVINWIGKLFPKKNENEKNKEDK